MTASNVIPFPGCRAVEQFWSRETFAPLGYDHGFGFGYVSRASGLAGRELIALADDVRELVQAYGVLPAARALGVPDSFLRGWADAAGLLDEQAA